MAAPVADYLANPGEEQAQVFMNLGNGPDRAASGRERFAAGNRDRRRDALDPLGIGLLQRLKELARIGREGLDVPPLPFGIDRVKRERALARPADPGHDDQPPKRQVQVDALEVMGADLAKSEDGSSRS